MTNQDGPGLDYDTLGTFRLVGRLGRLVSLPLLLSWDDSVLNLW